MFKIYLGYIAADSMLERRVSAEDIYTTVFLNISHGVRNWVQRMLTKFKLTCVRPCFEMHNPFGVDSTGQGKERKIT